MDFTQTPQSNASATNLKAKPAVPKKPVKLAAENDVKRTTHVRDMIRKLQERERSFGAIEPTNATKAGGKGEKIPAPSEKAETDSRTSHQTLEDLRAIDEDIEKLRSQIEERDKIISALREAAEVKDKKLDDLAVECSKLRSSRGLDVESSPEFDPTHLCGSGLCWTNGFVGSAYHELVRDQSEPKNACAELGPGPGSEGGSLLTPKAERENKQEGVENAINLIMAEQIRLLKEREAQLVWEAEELREQNDLMEFRILELEECRKEFLDKEAANEGKHRAEKIVWRERDLEEVSDSGVVSLPTSEDLTSDSELGDAIRNYSPLGAVVHLGLSTSDISHSDHGISDFKLKKSLKSAECLQESGIFVDAEPSDWAVSVGRQSKACQTEAIFEGTLLDIIDSSCNLFLSKNPGCVDDCKSDDLTTELSKLSVIQRRIQQKTRSPTARSPRAVVSCPHANSVLFYEERLGQLEDKLKIYESSGDAQGILLAKRLQKEVELARRVKELGDKVSSLEAVNKKLEEEKCEFEEAENDARLQCQRLEVRLQELIDKNADLELEVERRKAMMSEEKRKGKKQASLEGLLDKYEKRNFELEEKEMEAKKRLSMLEAAMPAIVAYNVFKMVQKSEFEGASPVKGDDSFLAGKKAEGEDALASFERLDEELPEHRDEKSYRVAEEESSTSGGKGLRTKIRKMEARTDKDREALKEMTDGLNAYEEAEKSRTEDVDLLDELKQLVANEIELRAQIERLEKKEQAYMQSLEKADEIWAGMEADYKRRLLEAEEANEELQKRVSRLEKSRDELERALTEVQPEADRSLPADDLPAKIRRLALENDRLKAEFGRNSDEKFEYSREGSSRDETKEKDSDAERDKKQRPMQQELELTKAELQHEREVGEKLRKDLEEKSQSVLSMESNLQLQISKLTQELSQKSKELSSLEVTVAELREEVETLENKVGELVETIQTMVKNQEVSTTARAARDLSWRPLPAGETYRRTLRSDIPRLEEVEEADESSIVDEIENEFLVPREPQIMACPVALCPRQETRFVFASSEFSRLIVLGTTQRLHEGTVLGAPNVEKQMKEKEVDPREEEIFQLSIKNTELQQTLERMDEESKLKDKELEELQKVALEIRKEQENLLSTYGKARAGKATPQNNFEESTPDACDRDFAPSGPAFSESGKTASIEFLQIINPIVIKTSDRVSTIPSSLQIAIDNLQNKCRWESPQNKTFFEEVKGNDDRDAENFVKRLAIDFPADFEGKEKTSEGRAAELCPKVPEGFSGSAALADFRRSRASLPRNLSASVACPALVASPSSKRHGQRSSEDEAEFSYAAPITTVRKVGDDGIFLEWDVTRQPESVVGFEIKVNGLLSHKVRSSTRNKALLRPLNLKHHISIHLFAMTKSGRSTISSHVTYSDDNILRSEESPSYA